MLGRFFFKALVVILFLYVPFFGWSQVTLDISNVPDAQLQPGKSQTVVLTAKNQSNDTLKLRLAFDIPKPLRALLFNKNVTILPHKSKNILVPISIPRSTTAGSYKLSFGLTKNGKKIVEKKITIEVARITEVKVELIEYPSYARSTDTIRTRFMVMNNGNSTELLSFRSENGIIKSDKNRKVPPDSTIFIDMWILNDPKTFEVEDQLIDLFALIAESERSVGDQEIIKVYPTRTVKVDPFFRFPVTANMTYFTQSTNGEYYNSIFQFEIAGNGALDVDQKHHLTFSYRGPGAVRITRIGNFSQKYLHYNSQKTNIYIGEKTYGLSELTEGFRFGTGVEFNTVFKESLAYGGYYNRPIFQPEIREQFASFITYFTKKKYQYRINTLNNYLREGGTVNLTSLQVDFTNFSDWRFAAEASRSFSDGKDGNALSYNTNFSHKKLRISSNGLYADKDFKGYYNNSLNVGFNAGYNFSKIGIQASGSYNNSNPNLDTVYSVAPITFYVSSGFMARITKGLEMQLLGVYREKTDRLVSKNFDYTEQRARYSMSYRRGKMSTRLLSEAGYTTNKLADTTAEQRSFGYDVQFQSSFRPKPNFWVSAFSQYLNNNRFSNDAEGYFLFGFDANIRYRKKFNLSAEFQNSYLIEDLYNDRNLLNFKMGYDFTRSQSFNMVANYGILRQAIDRKDWFWSFNYLMKLGVPMVRTMSLGTLEGQLVNVGVKSVENIVLMLDGQLVTTSSDGSFIFNNVKPGTHQLFIDRATIGVRDLPDQKLPLEVDIFAEQTTTISIKMTLSAKVTGKIDMEKVRMIQSSKEELKFPSIIVEASMGEESILTRADANGNFVFGSLRPGEWKIRMVPTYWKEDFIIKKPYLLLDLVAGQEEHLELLITPKVRRIKFLKKGSLKVGTKK